MPVFRSGEKPPSWCQLESFELIGLDKGQTLELDRAGSKEQIIVCSGVIKASCHDICCKLPEGGQMELESDTLGGFVITGVSDRAELFRAAGRWEYINGSGLFSLQGGDPPDCDSPYDYDKTTAFDNHYHDCDEYWIFLAGRATVVSEGKFYQVQAGDCLATGMGWHHDVMKVDSAGGIKAVWLESGLEGKKRKGHLWEPKHGKAQPHTERI